MTIPETYLLDSNVFIEAKRRYYAFNICPGFWDALVVHAENSTIKSIDRIKTFELQEGHVDDELKIWANTIISSKFFAISNEEDVLLKYAEIMAWVNSQPRFFPFAIAEFASSVDGWLIAYAKAKELILVTHEGRRPESKRSVMIPDVCDAVGVRCVDTFQMLQALHTQFILQR
jgi:hypothetical protein